MQRRFSDLEYTLKKMVTRRERFLREIEAITPWASLVGELEANYSKGEGRGWPSIGLERMLRMYTAPQCFGLSGEAIELRHRKARYRGLAKARYSCTDCSPWRIYCPPKACYWPALALVRRKRRAEWVINPRDGLPKSPIGVKGAELPSAWNKNSAKRR